MRITKHTGLFRKLAGIVAALGLFAALPAMAYTVQKGDTLWGIAQKLGTTVQQLVVANNIANPNLIHPGDQIQSDATLGAGYTPVTGYQSRTTAYISASATTIPVVSTKDKSGNQIVLSNISPSGTVKVYMNLESGTTKEEPIVCTGLTATSWTNCTRGLAFQGSSEISSSTIATTHNAGSSIIITNIGQFYNQFVSVDGDQTINDVKTFTSLILVPTTSPSSPNQVVSFYQFQQATSTGGVNGTTTAKGVYEAATDAELQAGTIFGATGAAIVAPGRSFNQTSTANKVPVSDGAGKLNPTWINTSTNYNWGVTQNFATTTASTSTVSRQLTVLGTITVPITPTSTTDATSKNYVDKTAFAKNVAVSTTARTLASPGSSIEYSSSTPGLGLFTAGPNDMFSIKSYMLNPCDGGTNATTSIKIANGVVTTTLATFQFAPSVGNGGLLTLDFINSNSTASQFWVATMASSTANINTGNPALASYSIQAGTSAIETSNGFNIVQSFKCSGPTDSAILYFTSMQKVTPY